MALNKERLLKAYRDMIMIRRFEEVVEEYATNGTTPGFVYLSIGQEACQANMVDALKKTDYGFPDHRGCGTITLYGADPKLMMAEIFAKETGVNHGRGGSMHVNDLGCRNMRFNRVQGSTMVTYLGTASTSVYSGTDDVMAIFLGDGTLGEGTYHESVNMTVIQKPPIIYCLISSGYAISARYEETHPREELKTWGEGYEVPSFRLDGNDVGAVTEVVGKAADHVRKGEGPAVLESMTYRQQGYSAGDPVAYHPEDEVSYWVNDRDPLELTKVVLLGREQVRPAVPQIVEEEEERYMQETLKFSLESKYPGIEAATTYTYADREVELR